MKPTTTDNLAKKPNNAIIAPPLYYSAVSVIAGVSSTGFSSFTTF